MLIVADDSDRTQRELAAGELAARTARTSCVRGATRAAAGCAHATAAAGWVPDVAAVAGVAAPTC